VNTASDVDLVDALRAGDERVFADLVDRYSPAMLAVARTHVASREVAEDVVQESFLRLWKNAKSFDARRGNVRSWLLSIVHNRAIDRLRGTTRMRKETQIETVERLLDAPDAWESVSVHLEQKQIRDGFAQLPAAQRQTLELAYFGGYTHLEIAGHMGVPLGTVKGRMRMGLEKMRTFLQARGVGA